VNQTYQIACMFDGFRTQILTSSMCAAIGRRGALDPTNPERHAILDAKIPESAGLHDGYPSPWNNVIGSINIPAAQVKRRASPARAKRGLRSGRLRTTEPVIEPCHNNVPNAQIQNTSAAPDKQKNARTRKTTKRTRRHPPESVGCRGQNHMRQTASP